MSKKTYKYRYRKIRVGTRTVDEHLLEMEKYLGRPLEEGEIVHHIDNHPLHNHIDNLELCLLHVHTQYHRLRGDLHSHEFTDIDRERAFLIRTAKERRKGVLGVSSWCSACKQILPVDKFHKQKRRWSGVRDICKECRKKQKR